MFLFIQYFGQIVHNGSRDVGLVHGVYVDVVYARGKEIKDLVGGVGNARLFHGGRLVAEFIDKIEKTSWHKRT